MNENTYKNGAISSNDIDVNTDCNDIIIIIVLKYLKNNRNIKLLTFIFGKDRNRSKEN